MKSLTPAQSAAIRARGNILLEAGAGSGKTSTLVARCLDRLLSETDPVSLDEILMVTFTEAAAAEMRRRIREELNQRSAGQPGNRRIHEQIAQLDQALIGTLHSFCFRLVREHFHELGLDPQLQVLDQGEARLLAIETVREVMDRHFQGTAPDSVTVLSLVRLYAGGDDQPVRELVISLHHYLQTLPNPGAWLDRQTEFWSAFDRPAWETALIEEMTTAIPGWLEQLESQPAENEVARRCARWLRELPDPITRAEAAGVARKLADQRAGEHWPRGTKGKFRGPILSVLEEAAALASFTPGAAADDPLAADFQLLQSHVLAVLGLVREFGEQFASRKRQRGGLDFSDLEQFSLRLLRDPRTDQPTPTARQWQARLREVFVDEYQDINEVQDRIIVALSRAGSEANRFLVGDVKQSIYGFRLARPDIFLRYASNWRAGDDGQVLPLSDNFRSHEAILEFVNHLFAAIMRTDAGGVGYPPEARLRLGAPEERAGFARRSDPGPRVEILVRFAERKFAFATGGDDASDEEQTNAEKEAALAAARLIQLRQSETQIYDRETKRHRPIAWRDMAILLRATSGKAEIYSRVFARAGVPLVADRRGFFDAIEISDLTSLFMLLDNPRQDIPLLAVLRSPVVGLTPDELVSVRASAPREESFWVALNRFRQLKVSSTDRTFLKVDRFLGSLARWREQARRGSLSQCLEDILAATKYLAWLATQPRGGEQSGNVQRLLELTRHYDSWQGRGLHRFLEYVRLIDADGEGPEPAPPTHADAVRLMTIHASKGLEFPVVVFADLNKPFRRDEPRAGFAIDDGFGLCPLVVNEAGGNSYPSLAMLRARRRQQQRSVAEEIRLLYVAMTRACDRLILLGTVTESRAEQSWSTISARLPTRLEIANARSPFDLLGPLLPGLCQRADWHSVASGVSDLVSWRIFRGEETIETEATKVPTQAGVSRRFSAVQMATIHERLAFRYPFLEATRRPGKTTVTRVRRQLAELGANESSELFRVETRPRRRTSKEGLSAAEIGIAHHAFFQNVRLDSVDELEGLVREADRLEAEGSLTAEERRALQFERILSFWSSGIGREILSRRSEVHRELEFTVALPASEIEELAGPGQSSPGGVVSGDDPVIVQGIVDLALISPKDIWIIDYKTDHVEGGAVTDRARRYEPQVGLYGRALESIYHRPVTRILLHFLHPVATVEVKRGTNR